MAEFISGNELARRLGISETGVRKYRDQGLFTPAARGANKGRYEFETCKAAYEANRDPDGIMRGIAGAAATSDKPAPGGVPENSLTRMRTIQAGLKAQQAQLQLQRARGEIIDRKDAQRAVLAVVRELTQRLDTLPSAAAPVCHAAPNVAEAEALLRGMVRAIRVEIAKLGETFDHAELRVSNN